MVQEHVPPRLNRPARLGLLALLAAVPAATGCVTLGKFTAADPATTQKICQVEANWSKTLVYAPDPTRVGMPSPALTGRVYLFGPNLGHPQIGDGKLTVEMFDETPPSPTHPPQAQALERWEFDKATLKNVLLKKDFLGWGYAIPLPWSTYSPEITQVRLTVRYDPPEGLPIYGAGSKLNIEHTPPPAGAATLFMASQPQPPPTPPPHTAAPIQMLPQPKPLN